MGANYKREHVEQLLELHWDGFRHYGPTNEASVRADMPGSKGNPAHQGGWMAELADLHTALRNAPLTFTERRRVFMRYGLGWGFRAMAVHDDVERRNAQAVTDAGVSKILRFLNGEPEPTDEDEGSE